MKTILIIEDEAELRMLVCEQIEDAGYIAVGCARVDDAKAKIAHDSSIDLIVTDLRMPGPGGLDLLKWLQEESRSIPTIIMTGDIEPEIKKRILQAGAAGIIEKPFEEGMLEAAITKALSS